MYSPDQQPQSAELLNAIQELVAQNEQKEQRAAALILTNEELALQNKANIALAEELLLANSKLAEQIAEKNCLAEDLRSMNAELAFQMQEKAQRASELETVNAELEAFSYSVSHDLRAPLRAINGFTEVIIEDYGNAFNDDARLLFDEIIANSKKMGQLIDNLLEFSRVGKHHISRADLAIDKIVDLVILELKQEEPHRNFHFVVKDLQAACGDRNMIKQVFVNLLSNAAKYSAKREESIIEIGSSRENNVCTYYVKDNGAGFDMRYSDKLFGIFQRLHSSSEFDGTGVGLAIVQKIVAKHGGEVRAEGEVNHGACFSFTLPAC